MDICCKAGANRTTFYLHYENIGDLAGESVENLINNFLEYYPGHNTKDVLKDIASGDKEKLVFLTPEYLLPFLNFIKNNRKLFSIVLDEGRVFNIMRPSMTSSSISLIPYAPSSRFQQMKGSTMSISSSTGQSES